MVNQSLKNKKIIISAGASGIGLATAKVCLARGAYVYLCDIDTKSLNKLNKHPLKNKRLFSYTCDASDENQVLDLFKKINKNCLLYTSPSPRDLSTSRMPSSA